MSPLECVEWLIKGADDEVYFAVSADFHDVDNSVDVTAIYAEYRLAYEKYVSAFTEVLGAPSLSVD